MEQFACYLYEHEKGVRNLFLYTTSSNNRAMIEERLTHRKIPYQILDISPTRINVFFGEEECIKVIKEFGRKRLNDLTPEEDFILGTMLGYDILKQCRRYLQMKKPSDKQ